MITNGSTPCKIASDPNLGWEETTGDFWEQGRALCAYINQPLTLCETNPEGRKPGTLSTPPHNPSTEVRSFLGHLPIMLYG